MNNNITTFYLIRHAKSKANITHVYGSDEELSNEGLKQAQKAHLEYKNMNPDLVISSSLKRAIQTAEIIFPATYNHNKSAVFNEINFGTLTGQLVGNKKESPAYLNPLEIATKYNGDNIWKRAEEFKEELLKLAQQYPYKKIAIISSDTIMEAFIIHLLLKEKENEKGILWNDKLYIKNCEYIKVEINNKKEIKIFNNNKTLKASDFLSF